MKKLFILFLIAISCFVFKDFVHADTAIDNALNYLRSQQDSTGNISNGFSAPSDWSAIAFTANTVDIATVKVGSDSSLLDFLITDTPPNGATATDWETRLLAIIASGQDPTNFGGINYVQGLESFYNNSQLGDTCSLNDDIFGLLAEIAAGPSASSQIKENTLSFLLQKQDAIDGGFSYSAPGCSFYGTSADITGAALAALVEAKNHGMNNAGLDDAIASASSYLSKNQDADGGFGYFGSSDTDTTGWVLQGLNAAGLQNSQEALNARAYLLSQQNNTDGGIMDFNYGTNSFASNSTTTAQALIALGGKDWIIKIFDPATITPTPSVNQTITPTQTPTPTTTPTPSPNIVYVTSTTTNTVTNTVYVTPTPEIIFTTIRKYLPAPTPKVSPIQGVLGLENQQMPKQTTIVKSQQGMSFSSFFLGMGVAFLGFYAFQIWGKLVKKS